MGGILESRFQIDVRKGTIFIFDKVLCIFKTLAHNPLMRRATENLKEFPLES